MCGQEGFIQGENKKFSIVSVIGKSPKCHLLKQTGPRFPIPVTSHCDV